MESLEASIGTASGHRGVTQITGKRIKEKQDENDALEKHISEATKQKEENCKETANLCEAQSSSETTAPPTKWHWQPLWCDRGLGWAPQR